MEIEVYLDSLFFMNLVINLWILKLVAVKHSLRVGQLRLLLSAALGAGIYVGIFFLSVACRQAQVLAVAGSVPLMTGLILPTGKRRLWLQVIGQGFAYSFILAGILRVVFAKCRVLSGREITLFMVLAGAYLCTQLIHYCIVLGKQRARKSLYDVSILSGGGEIRLKALLDTGNGLREPISQRPVCLIEEELLAKVTLENPLFYRAIPFQSIGCERGIVYGVEIPALVIHGEEESFRVECVVCAGVGHKLSARGEYQMILHPALCGHENQIKNQGERKCC